MHNGFKEIILVGIHVASYGVDLGDTTLESLIMDVDKIDGVERIRLSSIEPMTLNQEFIDSIKDSKSCVTTSIYRFNPVVTKH